MLGLGSNSYAELFCVSMGDVLEFVFVAGENALDVIAVA